MADDNRPLVQQRRLQAELRRLRDERRLTQREVATANDWSTSKMIRLETGATRIGLTDLRALLRCYDVTNQQTIEQLEALALASRERTWRDDYRQKVDPQFFAFLGFEATATRVRHVQSMYIPGLLQTQEYTRTIAAAHYRGAAEGIDRTMKLRALRQEIVTNPAGPNMTFLLDESVLRRRVGLNAVMLEQLRHLETLIDRHELDGRISIRYIPFGAGEHPGMGASFIILDGPPAADDLVVYVEEPVREILLPRDPQISKVYVDIFSRMEDLAADAEGTKEFLHKMLNKYADFPEDQPLPAASAQRTSI
jgi:transcriptional regulator with XRE-family HTH domain